MRNGRRRKRKRIMPVFTLSARKPDAARKEWTPRMRREFDRRREKFSAAIQPLLEEVGRSQKLTAEDFAATINC